jgi:hypothetical protein
MRTFAAKERRSAAAIRRSQPSRFGYRGAEVKAQRAAIHRILRSTDAQAKLTVGEPNDKYEQEADRVADQMVAMPDPKLQRQSENEEEEEILQTKPIFGRITPLLQRQEVEPVQTKLLVQRQAEEEEENEEILQTKEVAGRTPGVAQDVQTNINNLRGSGKPLPGSVRAFFEPRFGHNFSNVRVHNDALSSKSAKSLNAKAYTLGSDIVFDAGQYAPEESDGRELLAHELTHVVQQSTNGPIESPTIGNGHPSRNVVRLKTPVKLQRKTFKPFLGKVRSKEEFDKEVDDQSKKNLGPTKLRLYRGWKVSSKKKPNDPDKFNPKESASIKRGSIIFIIGEPYRDSWYEVKLPNSQFPKKVNKWKRCFIPKAFVKNPNIPICQPASSYLENFLDKGLEEKKEDREGMKKFGYFDFCLDSSNLGDTEKKLIDDVKESFRATLRKYKLDFFFQGDRKKMESDKLAKKRAEAVANYFKKTYKDIKEHNPISLYIQKDRDPVANKVSAGVILKVSWKRVLLALKRAVPICKEALKTKKMPDHQRKRLNGILNNIQSKSFNDKFFTGRSNNRKDKNYWDYAERIIRKNAEDFGNPDKKVKKKLAQTLIDFDDRIIKTIEQLNKAQAPGGGSTDAHVKATIEELIKRSKKAKNKDLYRHYENAVSDLE